MTCKQIIGWLLRMLIHSYRWSCLLAWLAVFLVVHSWVAVFYLVIILSNGAPIDHPLWASDHDFSSSDVTFYIYITQPLFFSVGISHTDTSVSDHPNSFLHEETDR
jgi:hypothetical protein